ncbi:DNA adenine methylase [Vibrio lentus]|uniref:DNA adenine methylase n=1 Tax=Vibrio lentus TaxID=136468 RepID=UPI001F52FA57|nr:DNA adenine methylase [Vibrio lentus]
MTMWYQITKADEMSYLGAKSGSGVYQTIINLMPPHDTYIEAFLGTGAIMRKKAPAAKNIGIDINASCVDKFNSTAAIDESGFTAADVFQADAFDFLSSFDFSQSGKTVIYCDPPYVHSTRTSSARYENELTDDDHKRLLTMLSSLPCFVLISGYPNEIYDDYLDDWWSVEFQAMTRGGVRTEKVWCNFTPGDIHYHTFAGKDSTDRQRIQRKAERWARNFKSLPSAEKQAVFSALLMTMES